MCLCLLEEAAAAKQLNLVKSEERNTNLHHMNNLDYYFKEVCLIELNYAYWFISNASGRDN